ncbi:MAG: xanthine dehydrogenase small subunit [Alphaproteobacteria bacterium]|nr:xanthine dehydrogenase small subunit [Alphaproteobacteria bacterium]
MATNSPKSDSIEYIRNGQKVVVTQFGSTDTLLDHLRLTEGSYGTKEGCCEGDCGACTVVLGRQQDGKMHYRPVNSCIYLLGMADGQELITVDDLTGQGAPLHPVQQSMVNHHATQCGFCTPGFVMALFALYHSEQDISRDTINTQLAGNLCRCTGYRPIVEAGLEACIQTPDDQFSARAQQTAKTLADMPDRDLFIGTDARFFAAPKTLNSLAKLYTDHPDATIVAGATDVGLWITKRLMDLPKIIYIGEMAELNQVQINDQKITIGAAVTYANAMDAVGGLDADIKETMRRIGSKQVRESGTIGGNIANGSPIGDMPPLLIAMGAEIKLQKANKTRTMKLEDYFIAYGKQDRQQGEFLTEITIPKLKCGEHFRAYKITKRFDQDISAVMAAFHFTIVNDKITAARIAFGGMAATPKRAKHTEAAIICLDISELNHNHTAFDQLAQDFTPMSDMRASADYRLTVAKGLLKKAIIELSDQDADTRIINARSSNLRAS